MKKTITILSILAVVLTTYNFTSAITNPLEGKVVAIDSGHGGMELGAQYPANCANDGNTSDCLIYEKDVNLDVVYALKAKLEDNGTFVVLTRIGDETMPNRKDRVDLAVQKCTQVDVNGDGVADNKKCDVLVSVHHNGNTNPNHDGTLTIYTQNSDKPLAKTMLDSLVNLTGINEGMLNGGYGMTVYKNLVSTITEAYYITNDCEAQLYLYFKGQAIDISQTCKDKGYQLENKIDREADLQVQGLSNYFASQTGGRGGKPR